ncbi:heme peroxidase, partial [Caulochytrium protostelioides]
ARDFLDRHVKPQFPGLSYADLWTLAAVVAIQEMGGPTIPWRPGRIDQSGPSDCPPNGRLPDGAKGAPHLRDIFYRMGFNDQEIVALTGAHALGRCHRERSGFEGPWTTSPTVFTNAFYTTLLDNTWVPKQWDGAFQYVDKATGELMMLPSDYALLEDPKMRVWVERYARDESLYFDHFAQAFGRLLELGV